MKEALGNSGYWWTHLSSHWHENSSCCGGGGPTSVWGGRLSGWHLLFSLCLGMFLACTPETGLPVTSHTHGWAPHSSSACLESTLAPLQAAQGLDSWLSSVKSKAPRTPQSPTVGPADRKSRASVYVCDRSTAGVQHWRTDGGVRTRTGSDESACRESSCQERGKKKEGEKGGREGGRGTLSLAASV